MPRRSRRSRRAAILLALGVALLLAGLVLAVAATPDAMPILDKLALRQGARAVVRELPEALATPGPARTVLGVGGVFVVVGVIATLRRR
jgi:hypothetical protein